MSIVSDRDPRFMAHYGDVVDDEHYVSYIDRWSTGEHHTSFGRHVTSMCPRS